MRRTNIRVTLDEFGEVLQGDYEVREDSVLVAAEVVPAWQDSLPVGKMVEELLRVSWLRQLCVDFGSPSS